ncbi:MAG: T9SS type A sorting domain-containing protein, partial [Chitinophagaceae bacterium]
ISGNFHSSIDFGNGTATLTATAGGTATDGFVAKFNSAGLCQWSIRFGGAATDLGGQGIVTNGTTVYVTGQSQFPATVGSSGPFTTVGGSTDGIVFALNASTGATSWVKVFGGGTASDNGQAICLDNSGNVYITGVFSTRTSNPTAFFGAAAAFPRTVQGSMSQATSDLFVARLNPGDGTFNWVSAGGASSQETPSLVIGNDNVSGSGITFVPGSNQLLVAGSFANANASYFSNGSASPSVTLSNAGQTDMCLLKLDLNGNFLSGFSAGGTTNDEALGITYDATTNAAYFAGYFNSSSLSGAISLTNSSSLSDEIFYARYDPSDNSFPWAKNASGTSGGQDVAFGINNTGTGSIYVTGRFQGTISFPTATVPLTAATSGADDPFLVKVNESTGNATQLGRGSGSTGTDAGLAVACFNSYAWVSGIFANSTLTFIPSSPPVSVAVGTDQELFIARYNDPPPVITTQPVSSTICAGLAVSFIVASSSPSVTYQWQESNDIGFSSPVTLTNTGIYSNTTTATLTISDNTTVNGKFYRAILSNSGGSVTSQVVSLTATSNTLAPSLTSLTQLVNTQNNLYFGGSCALIAKIIPSGALPVINNVTSQVFVEGTVPTYTSEPFVQRHYQLTAAVNMFTATATVTLYFSQAEFNAFNAAAGSVLDLPTDVSDNAGKANLRVAKYAGTSVTGLPGSISAAVTIIDPADANIAWNASFNRWEVSFATTGFGAFIVQTNSFALPVNLLSFSAQLSNNDISVNWKTADELNNDHFELERSTDGKTFTSVATVPALTSGTIKNYDRTDINAALLNTSKLYYRLKIVSISGAVEYSNIIIVFTDKSTKLVTGISPNPFTNYINVNLNMPAGGILVMKLTDLNGQIMLQQNVHAPKGFSTQVIKERTTLARGLYLLTASFNGQLYSSRVVKM